MSLTMSSTTLNPTASLRYFSPRHYAKFPRLAAADRVSLLLLSCFAEIDFTSSAVRISRKCCPIPLIVRRMAADMLPSHNHAERDDGWRSAAVAALSLESWIFDRKITDALKSDLHVLVIEIGNHGSRI